MRAMPLVISTRGNNTVTHCQSRRSRRVTRDMTIVALTGYDGGELASLLGPHVEIRIPSHVAHAFRRLHMPR